MGKIPNTNIYESIDACEDVSLNLINIVFDIKIIFSSFFQAKELPNIKIIRYEESIYYANADNFKCRIIKSVGINPEEIIKQQLQIEQKMNKKDDEGFFEKIKKKFMPKKSLVTIKQNGTLHVTILFILKLYFDIKYLNIAIF